MTKFSILIPNYGYSKYIEQSVKTAVEQTKNTDFDTEIIFFDQSNNDDFETINETINELDNDKKVRIIHTSLKSILNARINLIKESTGDYVVFLDSDDYISQDYLKRIFNCIVQNNYPDVIIQNFVMVDQKCQVTKQQLMVPSDIDNNIHNYFYYSNYLNSVVRKIFKRELFSINMMPQIDVKNGDDWLISLPIMKNAKDIIFIKESFGYFYRQNENSSTHFFDYQTAINALYFKDSLIDLNMSLYQKQLLLQQKIYDFINCFSFLIRSKTVDFKTFKNDCAVFRNNINNKLCLKKSNKLLSFKQNVIFYLIKIKLFRIIYLFLKY